MENINKKRDNFWKRFKVFLRALKGRLAACRLKAKADKSLDEYWSEELRKDNPRYEGYLEELKKSGDARGRAAYRYRMDYGFKKIKIKKEKKRRSEELKEAFKDLF